MEHIKISISAGIALCQTCIAPHRGGDHTQGKAARQIRIAGGHLIIDLDAECFVRRPNGRICDHLIGVLSIGRHKG